MKGKHLTQVEFLNPPRIGHAGNVKRVDSAKANNGLPTGMLSGHLQGCALETSEVGVVVTTKEGISTEIPWANVLFARWEPEPISEAKPAPSAPKPAPKA